MPESNHNRHYRNGIVYSYEKERQKKLTSYILFLTGLIIFLITLLGLTDGISNWTNNFLIENLGYTNKWSEKLGPPWFVLSVNDLSAMGGKVVLLIGVILVVVYYKIRSEHNLLWKFLIVILGAIIILIATKLLFADETPYEPIDLLISSIAPYPSGHAMLAFVFYLTLAVLLTRRQRREIVRLYTLTSACIIIFAIGISRIAGAVHTVTEVLAGWSLGLMWLCICWSVERYLQMKIKTSVNHIPIHNTSQ